MAMLATRPEAAASRLELSKVGFSIAGHSILSGVSLAVRPHEVVCLLGPSGCGKTTLLRIAAGIERQTEGAVAVAGRVVADADIFVPAEARRIGLVFQDLALFPHMRIVANVAFGLGRRGDAEKRAVEALGQVGLAGYERLYPHQLSGGQQQRVALARALLPAPSVVLFDEPFSSLDRSLRDAVREDVVALLRSRGATAVIVTHDAEEALSLADRVALMRDGTVVQLATPEEIWRAPVDLAAARAFSAVTAFHSRGIAGAADTPVGRVPTRLEGPLTVAFRPEALRTGLGGVEARVVRRRFFGAYVELSAEVAGRPMTLRADPSFAPDAATVRVMPDLSRAIVLPGLQ